LTILIIKIEIKKTLFELNENKCDLLFKYSFIKILSDLLDFNINKSLRQKVNLDKADFREVLANIQDGGGYKSKKPAVEV